MDALVAGEVQGTFSGSPGFGLALPRAQADQASGENLADFGQPLGGGHAVGIESVRQASDTFIIAVPSENIPKGATACRKVGEKTVLCSCFIELRMIQETRGSHGRRCDALASGAWDGPGIDFCESIRWAIGSGSGDVT